MPSSPSLTPLCVLLDALAGSPETTAHRLRRPRGLLSGRLTAPEHGPPPPHLTVALTVEEEEGAGPLLVR